MREDLNPLLNRPIRPPILHRPRRFQLPSINFNSIDFDDSSDDELLSHFANNESTMTELREKFKENKKKMKELEEYKKNYKNMIEKLPNHVLKKLVENNKCSICMEDKIDFENTYIITSCFHVFHERCIKQAQQFNKTCPICRGNLKNTYYKKFELEIKNKQSGFFN